MLKKELLNIKIKDDKEDIDDFFYTETDSNIINPNIILSFDENSTLNSPLVFNNIFDALNYSGSEYNSDQSFINNKTFYKLKYNIVLYDLINVFLIKKINNIEYIKNKSIFSFIIKEIKDRRKIKEYQIGYRVWKSLLGDPIEF